MCSSSTYLWVDRRLVLGRAVDEGMNILGSEISLPGPTVSLMESKRKSLSTKEVGRKLKWPQERLTQLKRRSRSRWVNVEVTCVSGKMGMVEDALWEDY